MSIVSSGLTKLIQMTQSTSFLPHPPTLP
uniref:Uncharacterized protein n=1 Tax=Anguilla anguilla TaxID=7936 RepID=A0A0E9RSJ1_ANGAN